MEVIEKISIEEIHRKRSKVKPTETESNRKAALTHYLHNSKNGVSQFYKDEAINEVKTILQYTTPETCRALHVSLISHNKTKRTADIVWKS